MPCEKVSLEGGGFAIVCTREKRRRCACGRPGSRLCDWKVKGKFSATCDEPLCDRCTHVPAPDKDLCPTHARQWAAMRCTAA